MQEKTIVLSEYKPHPQNYNEHPETQLIELEKSLQLYGQPKNIVVWRGHFLAGHGLAEAAKRQGLKTLKAIDVSEWDEDKALGFLIADNETARMAIRNDEILGQLLESINNAHVPGVDSKMLEGLLEDVGGDNEDLSDIEFKEFDEDIADDVEMITCPHCEGKFPK
jgi:hypothetical protein